MKSWLIVAGSWPNDLIDTNKSDGPPPGRAFVTAERDGYFLFRRQVPPSGKRSYRASRSEILLSGLVRSCCDSTICSVCAQQPHAHQTLKNLPMAKAPKTAIQPTRADDYPEWYQQVIRAADLAESSPVRGCMVIKPWGYRLWENMQRCSTTCSRRPDIKTRTFHSSFQ